MQKIDSNNGRVTTRRIPWSEFYRLRPDLRPNNDNTPPANTDEKEAA